MWCSGNHSGQQMRLCECVSVSHSKEWTVNDLFGRRWGNSPLHQQAGLRHRQSNSTDDLWKVWMRAALHRNRWYCGDNRHLLTVNVPLDTLHISCERWVQFSRSRVQAITKEQQQRLVDFFKRTECSLRDSLKVPLIIIVKGHSC